MYATQADMVERFGERVLVQLTDRAEPPADAVDAAVLDRALTDAAATIDAYLAARYALPLTAVPAMLVPIAADLAFYQLHPHGAPEEVRARQREAIRLLERLSSGTARLDVAGAEPAATGGAGVRVAAPDRVFSRDSLKDF